MDTSISNEFIKLFNKKHDYHFFSPGRVNLIGEHIDYNGGLVFPCAITYGTRVLVSKNDKNIFRFRSKNYALAFDIELKNKYEKLGKGWFNYPLGVIQEFINDGKTLQGLDFLFEGNVPIGSGLSSSASIEIATAYALNHIFETQYSKLDLVKMTKRVENNFIGVNSGIMDQFAVTFGEKGKAIVLDCNTLAHQMVPCDLGEYVLAIINTNKPRSLADSKYNERVQECQTALNQLKTTLDIQYLCDIDMETFEKHKHLIEDETVQKRAAHVVAENARVHQAQKELSEGNLKTFGQLMYASHQSLRENYAVSGKELDTLVDYCLGDADVAGARMTGAGFGGCAIALLKAGEENRFSEAITAYYTDKIGYAPSIYTSTIGEGVHQI